MAFVTDTFTESSDTALASHTPDSGGSWTEKWSSSGATVVASEDKVRGDSDAASSIFYHSATPATAEYDVEATVRLVTGSDLGQPGILGRLDHTAGSVNYFIWRLSRFTFLAHLEEVVNGSIPNSATYSASPALNTDYALKLELRNGTNGIKGYLDGVNRCTLTAGTLTSAGRAGLSVRQYGRIDGFTATDFAAGVTISCTPGAATAAGVVASVSSPITVSGTVGNAAASGQQAAVQSPITVACGVGAAIAAGSTASVASPTTIACTVGNAVAAGASATVTVSGAISCGVGAAVAAGSTATIAAVQVISCTVGAAVAAGLQASVTVGSAGTVDCTTGNAVAAGLTANIWTADIALPRTRRIGAARLLADRDNATLRASRRIGLGTLRRSA